MFSLAGPMSEKHGLTIGEAPPPVSHAELRERQQALMTHLPTDALLLIVNNPEAIRSRDVEHPYRANSDMLYLVGWDEPNAVVCLHNDGDGWKTRLYVPPRDVLAETWTGLRPGIEGALADWPVDEAASVDELEDGLKPLLDACRSVYHIRGLSDKVDKLVDSALLEQSRDRQRKGSGPADLCDPSPMLSEMRLIKSESELSQMRHACQISSLAHIEAMRGSTGGVAEYQLQSLFEGCFLWHGSRWAYPSIVGGGDNATILHYHDNDGTVSDGDLVLIDAGCEVNGYAADITRTWPVNGKFSDAQREIYDIVLNAQLAAIDACRVGNPYDAPHAAAKEAMAQGLLDLGVLEGPNLEEALSVEQLGQWYMHNTGHWLGLDVHDVGVYRPDDEPREFEVGMVITVEPGLYFGAWRGDVECPERYAGIGVRIEDDVLITDGEPDVLTAACPKEVAELEALIGTNA